MFASSFAVRLPSGRSSPSRKAPNPTLGLTNVLTTLREVELVKDSANSRKTANSGPGIAEPGFVPHPPEYKNRAADS